uniref:Uncharacterized protein n=1 Tax=Oryza sativa subsp. japonica TaxID=39947 RepID=Q6ZF43_ORYSJ|nr:hypothetical protein [Oryza sativa Japonica Group]
MAESLASPATASRTLAGGVRVAAATGGEAATASHDGDADGEIQPSQTSTGQPQVDRWLGSDT